MKIELLVRDYVDMIGLARYSQSICAALDAAGVAYTRATPRHPLPVRLGAGILRRLGYDLRTFFTTYPLSARFERNSLKHLTVQQMALVLLLSRRSRPAIVTVHDIVPYLVRHDRAQNALRHPVEEMFERLAMHALKRADFLICDSHFTKRTVVEALGYPEARMAVVPLGVDHNTFHPQPVPEAFRERFGLDPQTRYVLFVGSENPRKNLPTLLSALVTLRERMPNVKLIKAGSNQNAASVARLRHQIDIMGLSDAVLFFDHLSDAELALLYNSVDVFAFPSLYEGFGLPPLEAMACGTPVVCSNAASLPEVVGEAALCFDPRDAAGLAAALERVLNDAALRRDLRQRGIDHARRFTWARTAAETVAVYQRFAALVGGPARARGIPGPAER